MSEESELMRQLEAANEAYNRGDADGWLGPAHDQAVVFRGSAHTFIPIQALRSVAPTVLAAGGHFAVSDVQCRIVGDAAVHFGAYESTASPDAVPEVGSFSITYARVDGSWRPLFSHYTPVTADIS